jgi:hypothetical protein
MIWVPQLNSSDAAVGLNALCETQVVVEARPTYKTDHRPGRAGASEGESCVLAAINKSKDEIYIQVFPYECGQSVILFVDRE